MNIEHYRCIANYYDRKLWASSNFIRNKLTSISMYTSVLSFDLCRDEVKNVIIKTDDTDEQL